MAPVTPADDPLDSYTGRARHVIDGARRHAQSSGRHWVGTDDLLLSLVSADSGVAGLILRKLEILGTRVRDRFERPGSLILPPTGEPTPFSGPATRVLDLAALEAPHSGPISIGSDHLLLGLLREEGPPAQLLAELGAGYDRVVSLRSEMQHTFCYGCAEYATGDGFEPEDRPGAVRPPDLSVVDQQIADIRRLKADAIDAQDYSDASMLRDREKALLSQRQAMLDGFVGGLNIVAAGEEILYLHSKIDRLTALLQAHSIPEPDE